MVPARRAFADRLLPIGLATRVPLRRAVPAAALLTLDDVALDPSPVALRLCAELRPAA